MPEGRLPLWTERREKSADGDDVVIVAAKAGMRRPPAWHLNFAANRDVEAQVGREKWAATSRM